MKESIHNKLTGNPKPIKARQSRGKLSRNHSQNKKAIYKITNDINDKIYIGQSNNPNRRFEEHCKYSRDNTLIHKAIHKYGREHFKMTVLEWTEDYDNKEKEYIQKLNTLSPYGYNITEDANPPLHIGENSPSAKITDNIAYKISCDLKYTLLDIGDICKKYSISRDIVRHINEGHSWKQRNWNYPIREEASNISIKVNIAKILLRETNLSHELIANLLGMKRSFVTMINNGKNHKDKDVDYPIRKN